MSDSTGQINFRLQADSVELPLDDGDGFIRQIEERFRNYLSGTRDCVRAGNLVVRATLTDRPTGNEDDQVFVSLTLEGQLDGTAVAHTASAERNVPTPRAARRRVYEAQRATMAASSGLLGVAVRRTMLAMFPGSRERQPKRKHLSEMVAAATMETLSYLDKTIDRRSTVHSTRWTVLRVAVLLLSLASVPVWPVIYSASHPSPRNPGDVWGVGLITAAMAFLPTLGFFFAIAMLMMPGDFYTSQVAGQKLARNKKGAVKNAVIFLVLTLVMLCGLGCMVVYMFE